MAETTIGIIGSGSDGNSLIFDNGEFSFVIDNGFSCREFLKRANDLDLDTQRIKHILLTHAHNDHIYGVGSLANKLKVPLFYHESIERSRLKTRNLYKETTYIHNKTYSFEKSRLKIFPFKTYHDSYPSSGFYIKINENRLLHLTDTGIFNPSMIKLGLHSNIIFLEANYEPDMLENGPYPDFLKRRIKNETGHLSNTEALRFIDQMLLLADQFKSPHEKQIYLCHLSESNNSPDILRQRIEEKFSNFFIQNHSHNQADFCLKNNALQLNINILIRNESYKFRIHS